MMLKDVVIEPDGPSTISKEDEESKVSYLNLNLYTWSWLS